MAKDGVFEPPSFLRPPDLVREPRTPGLEVRCAVHCARQAWENDSMPYNDISSQVLPSWYMYPCVSVVQSQDPGTNYWPRTLKLLLLFLLCTLHMAPVWPIYSEKPWMPCFLTCKHYMIKNSSMAFISGVSEFCLPRLRALASSGPPGFDVATGLSTLLRP